MSPAASRDIVGAIEEGMPGHEERVEHNRTPPCMCQAAEGTNRYKRHCKLDTRRGCMRSNKRTPQPYVSQYPSYNTCPGASDTLT